jgi:hypothetical protein
VPATATRAPAALPVFNTDAKRPTARPPAIWIAVSKLDLTLAHGAIDFVLDSAIDLG